MGYLRNISRILLGIVFTFSGFVKIVDPMGTKYKFIDYFNAMHLDFLVDLALPFAVFMCLAEIVVGLMLLFNILPKLTSLGALLFMVAFTPLTLWLAVWNPVSDCGCFGDALILSNWETFYKNLILLALAVFVFVDRKKFNPFFNVILQWSLAVVIVGVSLIISVVSLKSLPILDFRPYKIGANISESMVIPENQLDNVDIYESVFIYEKDGEQREFSMDNLPNESWNFVDAKHKLIKEGYKTPIHDFSIEKIKTENIHEVIPQNIIDTHDLIFVFNDSESQEFEYSFVEFPIHDLEFYGVKYQGEFLEPNDIIAVCHNDQGEEIELNIFEAIEDEYTLSDVIIDNSLNNGTNDQADDITDIVLRDKNYSFILVSTHLNEIQIKYQPKVNELAAYCESKGYRFICLTADNIHEVEKFKNENQAFYDFYNTDPITLKTVVRANPGLLLIQEGTILNKWAGSEIPEIDKLERNLASMSILELTQSNNNRLIIIYILSSLFVVLLLAFMVLYLKKGKHIK